MDLHWVVEECEKRTGEVVIVAVIVCCFLTAICVRRPIVLTLTNVHLFCSLSFARLIAKHLEIVTSFFLLPSSMKRFGGSTVEKQVNRIDKPHAYQLRQAIQLAATILISQLIM